jgi:hypothetical protein
LRRSIRPIYRHGCYLAQHCGRIGVSACQHERLAEIDLNVGAVRCDRQRKVICFLRFAASPCADQAIHLGRADREMYSPGERQESGRKMDAPLAPFARQQADHAHGEVSARRAATRSSARQTAWSAASLPRQSPRRRDHRSSAPSHRAGHTPATSDVPGSPWFAITRPRWCAPQHASIATTQAGSFSAKAAMLSGRIRRRLITAPVPSRPTTLQLFLPKSIPRTAICIDEAPYPPVARSAYAAEGERWAIP